MPHLQTAVSFLAAACPVSAWAACCLVTLLPASTWRDFCRRVRTTNRMKGRMLKTHCKLSLGMTNTISCWIRLPASPKPFQCAPTAHVAPLGFLKAKPCCSSDGGFWGMVTWRAGRRQPGSLPSFQGPFPFPTSWQSPLCSSKLIPVPKARGPPCTHGTPKSAGPPHARVQLDPSF